MDGRQMFMQLAPATDRNNLSESQKKEKYHAKTKTHRASAIRFKRTGSGGLKRFRAYTSHRFTEKLRNNVVIFVSIYGAFRNFQNVSKAMLITQNNRVFVSKIHKGSVEEI